MLRLLLVLLLLPATVLAADKVYKWTDEQGNVHYSDRPNPDAGAAEVVEIPPGPSEEQVREAQQTQRQLENSARQLGQSRQKREQAQAESQQRQQQEAAEREKLIEEARRKWELQTDQPVTPWYPAYPGLPRPPNRPRPPLRPRPPVATPLPVRPQPR